jgi:putative ABC transport system permease protein
MMPASRRMAVAAWCVRVAALLVPDSQRADWQREWHGELASLADLPTRSRRPVRRAMGAFVDAFWLRQRSVADVDWIDDLRVGVRQLTQHAGFAVSAVSILALGLAAAVTMFSVSDQVLLRPLPYPQPERIVTLWETRAPDETPLDVAPANFLDWRERQRSFEHIAGVEPWSLDVIGDPRPEVWFAAKVTQGFFETFGLDPLHGRFFHADEYQKGRDQVVVLSEGFWRRRYAADPSIVGTSIRTADGPLQIVGIAPAAFEPRLLATAEGFREVWQPKAIENYEPRIRGSGYWSAVGRLRGGVSLDEAQSELAAISAQLAREYPRTNETTRALVLPLRAHLVGDVESAMQLLAVAVAVVLLIACVNVANLLLARGAAREREMAVRVALGARRNRLVQQLLLESLVIAIIGGLVGAILAGWTLTALARLGPASVPWIETLRLDWRALAFAATASGAVAMLAGLLPAYRVACVGLASAGRQTATDDTAQHRWRATLVVVEVALAVVLLVGAGLLARSFIGLINVDPGFQRDRVLVAQVFAYDQHPTPAHRRAFFDNTLARLASLPAVESVGAVSAMPFIESNINIEDTFTIVGRPDPADGAAPRAHLTIAAPGYFDAMAIPLKGGRYLDHRDGQGSPDVAVISDSLARRYWNSPESPIGQRLRFRFSGSPREVEVVGVVGSLRHDALDRGIRDEIFMPLAQLPFGSMTFVLRAVGQASALAEPTRQAIWAVSPQQTIYRTATLDELVEKTLSPRRFTLALILSFAAVALLLAVAGVYSVLTAVMHARLREMGLRVALGASDWDIVHLVVGRGLLMSGVGIGIGLAGALGAGRLLRSFLFEVSPLDPLALAGSAALMLLAAVSACYVPARRAAAADPVSVLRAE